MHSIDFLIKLKHNKSYTTNLQLSFKYFEIESNIYIIETSFNEVEESKKDIHVCEDLTIHVKDELEFGSVVIHDGLNNLYYEKPLQKEGMHINKITLAKGEYNLTVNINNTSISKKMVITDKKNIKL